MGKITPRDKDALEQLVLDCNMYNLSESQALDYIKKRFGKAISGRTFRRYKMKMDNGNVSEKWMSYFTRTGYIVIHHMLFETTKHLLDSSMYRLLQEEKKVKQDDNLIIKLKQEIREEIELVTDFSMGTTVVLRIKERADNLEKRIKEKEELLKSQACISKNITLIERNPPLSNKPRVTILK